MAKTWAEEVDNARSVIEPILEDVRKSMAPDVRWTFYPSLGFEFDAVGLDLARGSDQARVLVTFETWISAASGSGELRSGIESVIRELATGQAKQLVYLITTTGVVKKPRRTATQRVLDEAAEIEADAVVERFKRARASL